MSQYLESKSKLKTENSGTWVNIGYEITLTYTTETELFSFDHYRHFFSCQRNEQDGSR
jgi:hypothetical protein